MAKKRADLNKIFKPTEPKSSSPDEPFVPTTGRTISIGVGLKEGEVAMLDDIAEKLGVTRNSLMRYALRNFMLQYQAGTVNPADDIEEPAMKKTLKMP